MIVLFNNQQYDVPWIYSRERRLLHGIPIGNSLRKKDKWRSTKPHVDSNNPLAVGFKGRRGKRCFQKNGVGFQPAPREKNHPTGGESSFWESPKATMHLLRVPPSLVASPNRPLICAKKKHGLESIDLLPVDPHILAELEALCEKPSQKEKAHSLGQTTCIPPLVSSGNQYNMFPCSFGLLVDN